jgi:hypothetical protein
VALQRLTRYRAVSVAETGVTVATSGRPRNIHESHKKQPISSVSNLIDPKVATMLLHENHSHTCLTTLGIKGSWFERKKRTLKKKTTRSKCSSRFSSNPSVEIFLGSHSTSRNKRFTKRSTTERDRMREEREKHKNMKNKTQITNNTS